LGGGARKGIVGARRGWTWTASAAASPSGCQGPAGMTTAGTGGSVAPGMAGTAGTVGTVTAGIGGTATAVAAGICGTVGRHPETSKC